MPLFCLLDQNFSRRGFWSSKELGALPAGLPLGLIQPLEASPKTLHQKCDALLQTKMSNISKRIPPGAPRWAAAAGAAGAALIGWSWWRIAATQAEVDRVVEAQDPKHVAAWADEYRAHGIRQATTPKYTVSNPSDVRGSFSKSM